MAVSRAFTAPSPVLEWLIAKAVRKLLYVVGREKEGAGGPLCPHPPCKLLRAVLARLGTCQASVQQRHSAPWIPDKDKIIAASSYIQLTTKTKHGEELCWYPPHPASPAFCCQGWQTWLVLCISVIKLRTKMK